MYLKKNSNILTSQVIIAFSELGLDVNTLGEALATKSQINIDSLLAQAQLHEALCQEQVLHPMLWQR